MTSTEDWICGKCWYSLNPMDKPTCDMCGAIPSLHSPQKARSIYPSMSELEQPPQRKMTPSPSGNLKIIHHEQKHPSGQLMNKSPWNCSVCTYSNKEEDKSCQMCSGFKREPNYKTKKMAKRKMTMKRQRTMLMCDVRRREEERAMKEWRNIIAFCQNNGVQYIDDSFKPGPKSLYFSQRHGSDVEWQRCEAIRTANQSTKTPWVVYEKPVPDDIQQGALGNCWFISALAVLAEREDLLEKVILTKKFCKEGAYHVRLCKDGNWKTVLIDDLFPCDQYKRFLYSRAKRNQLWVPLIEKAAAKLHGCYEALTSGNTVEAMAMLTGEPCQTINLQATEKDHVNPEIIWSTLMSCRDSRFLMGASCGSGRMKVDEKHYEKLGLVANHAYSLLDIQIIQGNKLVKLRNPWGHLTWKGDWSEGSQKWHHIHHHVKATLDTDGKEGIFWMSFSDILKFFNSVSICQVHSDWMETRLLGTFPVNTAETWKVVNISVVYPCDITLGLFQKSMRGKRGKSLEPLVDLLIVILENRHDGQHLFTRVVGNSRREVRSFVDCSVFLKPGEYTIVCMGFKHWWLGRCGSAARAGATGTDSMNRDYTLAIWSSKLVITDEIDTSTTTHRHVLSDTLIQVALEQGEQSKLMKGITLYSLYWTGAIFIVENSSHDEQAHIEIDCSNSTNVLSTRRTLKTLDCIPPRHRQVIIVLTPVDPMAGWSTNRSIQSRLKSGSAGLGNWASKGVCHKPDITVEVEGLHAPRPF